MIAVAAVRRRGAGGHRVIAAGAAAAPRADRDAAPADATREPIGRYCDAAAAALASGRRRRA